jgi:hypothetical protein
MLAVTAITTFLVSNSRASNPTFCDGGHSGADGRVCISPRLLDRRMEKGIMTTAISMEPTSTQTREPADELRDEELDGATGGLVVISIIGILVGLLLPAVNPSS